MKDPQFQAYLKADPKGAMEMLDRITKKLKDKKFVEDLEKAHRNKKSTSIGPDSIYEDYYAYVTTTLVQQNNGYYCGPASALMAIWGWGGNVSGANNYAKQQTLGTAMGTNQTDGTYVYMLRNVLNSYISTNQYDYYGNWSLDWSTFMAYSFASLTADRAPIIRANTQTLSYYGGRSFIHYITITDFDYSTMRMCLYDPHIDNTYYGAHSEPSYNVFDACTYLIANA